MVTAICTLLVTVAPVPVTVTVPLRGVSGGLLDEPPHDAMINIMAMTSRPSRLLQQRRFLRTVPDRFRRGTSSTAANSRLLSMPNPRGESDGGLSSREVSIAALIVSVEVPLAVKLAGLSEQPVVPSPATLHERLMVPENPASVVTVIVSVPVPPLLIVRDELLADKVKPWFTVTATTAVRMRPPLVPVTVTFPVRGVAEVLVAAMMVNTAGPLTLILEGMIEHVVAPSEESTVHVRLTVPSKLLNASTSMVSVPDPPLVIASMPLLLRASPKSGLIHAETSAETSTEPHPLATS